MISSRPERLQNSPKPRLFKAESASNIRPHVDPMIHVLEKKTLYTGVRRAHSSCAPNSIQYISTVADTAWNFLRRQQQRLKFVSAIADSA